MSARTWMTAAIVVAAGAAGCGGETAPRTHTIEQASRPPGAQVTTTSASPGPTPSDDPVPRVDPDPDPPGARAIRAVAERYTTAIGQGDYAAACRTRAPGERAWFAAKAGSCADLLERILPAKDVADFLRLRATEVRRRGDLAGVDMVMPGEAKPLMTLAVRRVHCRWLLQDTSDKLTP